jgi:hypothetical protein
MRYQLIILLLLFFWKAKAQDTVLLSKDYYGVKTIVITTSKDTLQKTFYPSGKLASVMPYNRNNKTCTYTRYSEIGKRIYEAEIRNEQFHGKVQFYDTKGKNWATLRFESGQLVDTVFIRKGNTLVFGKASYSSIVYGGALNEDGTSNIQESKGVIRNMKFILYSNDRSVETSTLKGTTGYSDDFGFIYFQLLLQRKGFALFPYNEKPKSIQSGQLLPEPSAGMSHFTSWQIKPDLGIHSKLPILWIELISSSVGYAP